MPSLSEAMERATCGLYRAGDVLDEILRATSRLKLRRRLPHPYDGLMRGLLGLAAVAGIDALAGHPPILQVLYLAPVWIAFETAGLDVAAVLALLVVPVAAAFSPRGSWGLVWDLAVRTALMASLVAIMTFHSRRYRTTHESAQRDPLTGAFNRGGFETRARAAIDAAVAESRVLTLAVVDLDDFKALNDTKGHAFGDGVLRTLVRTLASGVDGAILGRTGGDEFVVIDPRRDAEAMREALGRALKGFTDSTLVLGRRSTFTVGIARLGPDGVRYETLLEAADRDMYRAKFDRCGEMLLA